MGLLRITDGLSVNPDAVESLERKGKLSCKIVMVSGEEHLAEFPYETMMARINGASTAPQIVKV